MIMTSIAEEYAAALFALAAEENSKGEVAESLEAVRDLMRQNPEYVDLLCAPSIPLDERLCLIDKAFGEYMHEYAVSFVKLICERGHIRELDECISEYLKLYEASDGTVTAYVTSAMALDENERAALAAKLEAKLSRRVELVCDVDASILGGVIIKVDGNIMDGSLKTKLAEVGTIIAG